MYKNHYHKMWPSGGLLFILLLILSITSNAQNCSINAGTNFSVCSGNAVNLDGSIGGPVQNSNTIQWSVFSQPAGADASIANSNSLMTAVNNATVPGNYIFRFSVTCGDGVAVTDDITVTVKPVPAIPQITGTASYPCWDGTPINVTGTAPASGETVRWTVTGGNTGTFANASAASTTFTPDFPPDECNTGSGTSFILRYTITNASGCQAVVNRTYTVQKPYALSATAYPARVCGNATSLTGSCPGQGTPAWTQVSGPNTANLATPGNRSTSATGLIGGTYTFRYTVTGGCNPGSADVTVEVAGGAAPTPANAGKDQYHCTIPSVAVLSGNAPAVGETVTWSQVSGGTATIETPNAANTNITGISDAGADYIFTYTISNGVCSSKDTVRLVKIPDVAFTATNVNTCNTSPTAVQSSANQQVKFGTFGYNQLDTVWATATYLSGPASTAQLTLWQLIEPGSGGSINGWDNNFTLGQTKTMKLSGATLYQAYTSPTAPAQSYYLSFTNRVAANVTGTFKYRLSFTTKCGTKEQEVIFTKGNTIPSINAGTDAMLPCNATGTVLAGNLADGVGLWRTIQMPAGATDPVNSSNQSLRNPSLTGFVPGTYIFRYSSDMGPNCAANQVDDMKVTVSNNPPVTPSAGADKTTCAGSVTLSGSAVPPDAGAQWIVVSPASSGVTFTDPAAAVTTAQNLQPNTTYVFRYTLTNSCGNSFDEVTVNTNSSISPAKPVITGLADCGSSNVTIPATSLFNITYPAYTAGTDSTWQFIPGPGATITARQALSATQKRLGLNVTQPTSITVIYTLSNPACPLEAQSDTLTAFLRASNSPAFTAGPNQEFCSATSYPHTITLSGTDYGFPVIWKQIYSSSGNAATINNPGSATTTASIPGDGIYRFQFEMLPLSSRCPDPVFSDIMQVTVSQAATMAMAGDDINFCNGTGTTNLAASPITVGTGRWEVYQVQSGIAPAVADPASPTSAISFSGSGRVVMRWSSYGPVGECGPSSSDLVTVTYIAPAQAGNDQSVCSASSVSLNALNPSPATGQWTQTAGTAAAITDPSSPQTTVTGLSDGTYTFRWSVTGPGGCSSSDDVTVTVASTSTTANAGPDIVSCSGGTNVARLNATPAPAGFTGTWQVVSKPAGASNGSFTDIHSPTASYNGMSTQGSYVFAWTVSNGTCSSTDYVELTASSTACTLPVNLVSFTADETGCQVKLNWSSSTEINTLKYIIERSEDGTGFTAIGEVAAAGTSDTVRNYSFTDANAKDAPVYYYRLKMVDRDASFEYSGTAAVRIGCKGTTFLKVLPSIAAKGQTWQLDIYTPEKISKGLIEIRNATGQVVHTYPVVLQQGSNRISYPAVTLSAGIYFVQLKNDKEPVSSARLVIQ